MLPVRQPEFVFQLCLCVCVCVSEVHLCLCVSCVCVLAVLVCRSVFLCKCVSLSLQLLCNISVQCSLQYLMDASWNRFKILQHIKLDTVHLLLTLFYIVPCIVLHCIVLFPCIVLQSNALPASLMLSPAESVCTNLPCNLCVYVQNMTLCVKYDTMYWVFVQGVSFHWASHKKLKYEVNLRWRRSS